MQEAIQLALGYVLGECPWYLLACVPFMGRRRVSQRSLCLMVVFMMVFQVATAFLLVLAVPDWRAHAALAYVPNHLLLIALFICAFRASPVRLFYVFLLVYSSSTCVNQTTMAILQLLFPQRHISMSTFPLLTAFMVSVLLALLPVLYPFMRGSLRRAVEELDTRSILLLCVSPLLFAVAALIFVDYTNGFAVKSGRLRSQHELETRLALQAQNFENPTQSIAAARSARHDLRHHISGLRDFAARDDRVGLLRYLEEYAAALPDDDGPDWCESRVVNALLRRRSAPPRPSPGSMFGRCWPVWAAGACRAANPGTSPPGTGPWKQGCRTAVILQRLRSQQISTRAASGRPPLFSSLSPRCAGLSGPPSPLPGGDSACPIPGGRLKAGAGPLLSFLGAPLPQVGQVRRLHDAAVGGIQIL